jgi:hypothetical protein
MKLLTKNEPIYSLYDSSYFIFCYFYLFFSPTRNWRKESILLTRVKVIKIISQKGNSSALNVFEVNNEVYIKEIEKGRIIPINDKG